MRLPKVITSSVIRSSQQGESHGGVYLVDFENSNVKKVLDWDDPDIDWAGRGKDRGLRGIAFYKNQIILAASNEIFFYDTEFNKINSYTNKYLNHCHEICIENDVLYLTSTGFDSIIEFDLNKREFTKGYEIRYPKKTLLIRNFVSKIFKINIFDPVLKLFNPNSNSGPLEFDQIHINNVGFCDGYVTVSGRRINKIYGVKDNKLKSLGIVPLGTHNATLLNRETLIFNDTSNDDIKLTSTKGELVINYNIPTYESSKLKMNHFPKDYARQGFGRGLTICDKYLLCGSSPATLSIYDKNSGEMVKSINITMDVRNAIHGLEIWPF